MTPAWIPIQKTSSEWWLIFFPSYAGSSLLQWAFTSYGAHDSHCSGFSCCGAQALKHRPRSCGIQAELARCMWDLPGPGIKPTSPALQGRFLTTGPPGKPLRGDFLRATAISWSLFYPTLTQSLTGSRSKWVFTDLNGNSYHLGWWWLVKTFKCIRICMHAKSLQLCLTLCDPMDCSPLGSSVHGIHQARTLEWVSMPSSRGSSWPRDQTHISDVSCIHRRILYH